MKNLVTLLAVLWGLFCPAAAGAQSQAPVVVELFTSQGCPACPPAEAYLRDLARRGDVIALEFHIDYYDYAGWKDPFGHADHTRRWQGYAQALGARYEYTPFMVVGGAAHVVGSNRQQAETRIRGMRSEMADAPRLTVASRGREATVTVDGGGQVGIFDIFLVTYDQAHETLVTAGENRGKTLVEANVVRGVNRAGQWAGAPVTLTVTLDEMQGDGGCAVLLQRAGGGPIVAAASFPFDG
ncbi:MAG: DUF1223 domain-containing protein [Alphaproteobacteria bacterium]|nr:DUF1223 domain-containing protein [Alphaproteobacteria bacterium]